METNKHATIFRAPVTISPLEMLAYDYQLPESLIATRPSEQREDARLLIANIETGDIEDRTFHDLPRCFKSGDLIIFNNTRVLPARIYTKKHTGGRVELLVLHLLDAQHDPALDQWHAPSSDGVVRFEVMTRTSKPLKTSQHLKTINDESIEFVVVHCTPGRAIVEVQWAESPEALLEHLGQLPLPPYIVRQRKAQGMEASTEQDKRDYQTVFAKHPGAVAAPTASLHFGESLLSELKDRGVEIGFVTLHVGIGTFKPVDTERLDEHPMHSEHYLLDEQVCQQIDACRARGGRIFAVGTTTARVLETEARKVDGFRPTEDDTTIFLHPENPLQFCDGLITNFHLPRSTLLALVAGAVGYPMMRKIYEHAVEQRYTFYSYGDGMLLFPIRREIQ